MVVHIFDLGETFFHQPCRIFTDASICSSLIQKHPLALNQFPSQRKRNQLPSSVFLKENSSLHPQKLSIQDPFEHGSRTLGLKLSSNKNIHTSNIQDKRAQYLIFGNQTRFSMDHLDFQCYLLRCVKFSYAKLDHQYFISRS